MSEPKPIIGLAGGIGSGKSAVAAILADLGAGVIDADRLAREELADPDVVRRLKEWWGEPVCRPDGTVDRAAIANIVFDDPAERSRLTDLIHPRVARRREAQVALYRDDPTVCAIVIDSPLLFEAGLDRRCDVTVFVHADAAVRLARVRAGRGWTKDEVTRREKFQKPLDMKRRQADYIVVNNSGLDELRSQVEQMLSRALEEANRTR